MPMTSLGQVKRILGGVIVAIATGGSAVADTTCTIKEKLNCSEGQGCKPVQNAVVVRLNVPGGVYSRCDTSGCDDLPATFTPSGVFIVVDLPGRGAVAKMTNDGSSFVEVVTSGTNVLVSFGKCQ